MDSDSYIFGGGDDDFVVRDEDVNVTQIQRKKERIKNSPPKKFPF